MFSSWKKENKDVLNQVVCRALDLKVTEKQESDEYCGVFVDARPRGIGLIEEYAAFKSFKLFSKYNYPIFALINENYIKDFLNEKLINDWRITVIPIKNLDCSKNLVEYSNFMIKEVPFLISEKHNQYLFFQADGFLLNSGWEDLVEHYYPYFCGAPNRHFASICFPENHEINTDTGIISMNGGFSFRNMKIMRELSKKYGSLKNYERGREDFQSAPEDLFWTRTLALDYPQNYDKSLECGGIFSQDPLKSFEDIKNTYGFHSCQT